VSIGEDLAEARRRAGLTVTQISQRTCIRQAIIAGIERDEFGACGGGLLRPGAHPCHRPGRGADPGPLIAEYDAAHRAPQPVTAADLFRPARPVRMPARHRAGWATVLGLALAAAVGLAAYHVITTSRHAGSLRGARSLRTL